MGFQQPSPHTDKVFDAARKLEYKVNIVKEIYAIQLSNGSTKHTWETWPNTFTVTSSQQLELISITSAKEQRLAKQHQWILVSAQVPDWDQKVG